MSAAKLVSLCFAMRTQAHINHLATQSYAQHKALNEFYDEIVDLADSFAESYQGRTGELLGQLPATKVSADSIKMLEQAREWLDGYRKELVETPELQNSLDSIVELINSTLYKLRNLK